MQTYTIVLAFKLEIFLLNIMSCNTIIYKLCVFTNINVTCTCTHISRSVKVKFLEKVVVPGKVVLNDNKHVFGKMYPLFLKSQLFVMV